MRRDLLDLLRCPRDHEPSWLVAVVTHVEGVELLHAELACPFCAAEFPIRGGVASFGEPTRAEVMATGNVIADDAPDAERVAALLGVTSGAYPVLLTGRYARAGAALASLIDVPQVWLDAPPELVHDVPNVSVLTGSPSLPFGPSALAGAAVDPRHATDVFMARVVRALRPRARLLSSALVPVPAELRELARDSHEWVAEPTAAATATAGGLVSLHRRPSAT